MTKVRQNLKSHHEFYLSCGLFVLFFPVRFPALQRTPLLLDTFSVGESADGRKGGAGVLFVELEEEGSVRFKQQYLTNYKFHRFTQLSVVLCL